jgi:hypothetical protein
MRRINALWRKAFPDDALRNTAIAATPIKLGFQSDLWAKGRGITSIELNVYQFNDAALALYRAVGFSSKTDV